MKSAACTVRAATCALLALGLQAAMAGDPLPSLAVDRKGITVSGLSSGGYMAVQLQVAYAATFSGVAAVAAGPYYCAEGSARHASERCLTGEPEPPVTRLAAITRAWAALGLIDATHHLRHTRAYLFSGQRDSVVRPAVTDALARYLRAFVPEAATRYRNDVPAEHGMVTDDHGQPCGRKGRPFINDCDFDLAGELLAHLYGPLQPRGPSQPPGGRFVEFDQREFILGRGMADSGWLFVPDTCQRDTGCRLHVVLHGCGQNTQRLGDEYVRHTGYNRWAATNRIVMLYPQTSSDAPHACWDWWGYTGPHYAQRTAPQMGAIKAMVERLTGR